MQIWPLGCTLQTPVLGLPVEVLVCSTGSLPSVGHECFCLISSVSLMTTLLFRGFQSLSLCPEQFQNSSITLMGKLALCLMTLKSPVLLFQLHQKAKSSASFCSLAAALILVLHSQQAHATSKTTFWLQISVHFSLSLPSLES